MKNFRQVMESHMKQKGVTQRFIATSIGEHPSTFSNWMNGRHRPSENAILAMARLLYKNLQKRKDFVYDVVHALSMDTP